MGEDAPEGYLLDTVDVGQDLVEPIVTSLNVHVGASTVVGMEVNVS